MPTSSNSPLIDHHLMGRWLAARSLARGLPAPVLDHGGWRVDSGQPGELRRYVFAAATPAVRALAESIAAPAILIKMCCPAEQLLALMPPGGKIAGDTCMMTRDHADGDSAHSPALPPGYRLERLRTGPVMQVRILAADASLAASGYAVEHDGVFIVDRIRTQAGHQRRGLGTALMAALTAARRNPAARQILSATAEGRALYLKLGWRIASPYATVEWDGAAPPPP